MAEGWQAMADRATQAHKRKKDYLDYSLDPLESSYSISS